MNSPRPTPAPVPGPGTAPVPVLIPISGSGPGPVSVPGRPAVLHDPVDPVDRVDPVDPVDPLDPVDPSDPVDPDRARCGGYVLAEAEGGEPDVLLIACGGEAATALDARAILQRDGIAARVVAMPRLDRFRQQPAAYREQVLPARVRARVSVTAGAALGWYELLGDAGIPVGLDRSGTGTPYTALLRQHGFTAERVAATARASLARTGHRHREHV
ncbi:transketolase-like TK C-terminal-containing protein [Streptomyces sp. NPDC101206]|uniref:transketolase-like TK C-terminal-containing protein n=1 Tax=Streptomyces sp. NPDC101206 TaxID=3366128 RepID=UPI00381B7BA9